MRKIIVFVSAILFFLTGFCFAQGEQDSITITTYYPSPYGVYKTLRLYPGSKAASCNTGEITYDDGTGSDPAGCYSCNGGTWQPLGGGAGGHWTVVDVNNYLYTNADNWNVGIGTDIPAEKLHVAGGNGIQFSDGSLTFRLGEWTDNVNTRTWTYLTRGSGTSYGSLAVGDLYVRGDQPELTGAAYFGGNVGIGTTNPGYELDVAGQANATEVCIGGDCKNSWPAGTLDCYESSCSGNCATYCNSGYERTGCVAVDGSINFLPGRGCQCLGATDCVAICCRIP